MRSLYILLSVLAVPFFTQAQVTWGTETTVADGASYNNMRPRVALTANNVPIVMWSDATRIYVARWNGTAFDTPVVVTSGTYNPFSSEWAGPDLACKGDSVFVVFKAEPEMSNPVVVVRSVDGGLTFGAEMEVIPGSTLTRFPDVAVNEMGQPTISVMEYQAGWTDPQYATVSSSDYGASYGSLVEVSASAPGEVCDCCESEIIANGDERTVMFRNNDSNLREQWMSYSADGGATYTVAKEIDTTNYMVTACMSSGPDGMYYYDSLATVWMSASTGPLRVYVSTLDKTSWNYGIHSLINPGVGASTTQDHPRIAGEDDILAVVLESYASGNRDVVVNYSLTGVSGLVGSSTTVHGATSGTQLNPDLAYANGVFHIVWQDDYGQEVMYRTLTVGATGMDEPQRSLMLDAWPNPAQTSIKVSTDDAINLIEVIDAVGRTVLSVSVNGENSVNLDVSELSNGMYTLKCNADDGSGTRMVLIAR